MADKKDLKLPGKNFDSWKICDKYEIIKQIGVGSYGSVVQAKDKKSGKKFAIKRISQVFDDLIDGKRILREIALLRRMEHINIVNVIEIIEPDDMETYNEIFVVLEYAQSDLKKLFKSPLHQEMKHINTLCYGILVGLKYVHSAGVLHRDQKPANVLINEDCSVKICDFGLARSVEGMGDENEEDKGADGDADDIYGIGDLPKAEKKPKKEQKKKNKPEKKEPKKDLTSHVVTRWYRAPEQILIEKNYDVKIDVWSLGCIYAELLGMLKEHAATFLDRGPLFPGTSCFPLSPDTNARAKKSGFPVTSQDQQAMIFSILGTPTDVDLEFVSDDKALEYLRSFPNKVKSDYKVMFPAAPPEAIDFLEKTMRFNPEKRLTIDECLNHPLQKEVRQQEKEKGLGEKISFEFEDEEIDTEARQRLQFNEQIKLLIKK